MGDSITTKLIIIYVIRGTIHDTTGTWVNASYNRRNNKHYGLYVYSSKTQKNVKIVPSMQTRISQHVCCYSPRRLVIARYGSLPPFLRAAPQRRIPFHIKPFHSSSDNILFQLRHCSSKNLYSSQSKPLIPFLHKC